METKDTLTIQLASLDSFANSVGYERIDNAFIFKYPCNYSEMWVSFKTMLALHNALWKYDETFQVFYPHRVQVVRDKGEFKGYRVSEDPFTKVFKLSPYEHRKTQSHKIVERVKIQCNKHHILHCQSNDVEFVCPLYEKEFLGE